MLRWRMATAPNSASQIIYKYTDQNGARKILSTRTLRFGRPSEMNDPFDVYIEDLLGMDLEEMHERGIDTLIDTLANNPQLFANRCGVPLEMALANSERLRNSSEEEKLRIKQIFKSMDLTALDPEYKALRNAQPELRENVAHYLRNAGIFCATKTFANLLMWAHYESPRVYRRLQLLRGWSHEERSKVFAGSSRTGGPIGVGAARRARIPVDRDNVDRQQDGMHY
jgi:hypothetical protein